MKRAIWPLVLAYVFRFQTRLHIGLYVVYLTEWMRVFPRDQIHILRLDDYTWGKDKALRDIFQFLGLRK